MKNNFNKNNEKERQVRTFLPNEIFNIGGGHLDSKGKDEKEMKLMHLYLVLVGLTRQGRNNFRTNIQLLAMELGIDGADAKTQVRIKERLNKLMELEWIKIESVEVLKLKKNDIFKIEVLSKGETYTAITESDWINFEYLGEAERVVYFFLLRNYNEKIGYSFPSYENMRAKLGMSPNTISNAINSLKECGLIKVDSSNDFINRKNGRYAKANNRYYILDGDLSKVLYEEVNESEDMIEYEEVLEDGSVIKTLVSGEIVDMDELFNWNIENFGAEEHFKSMNYFELNKIKRAFESKLFDGIPKEYTKYEKYEDIIMSI